MELVRAIKTRKSVREFKATPVTDSVIRNIIELGNLAPSAGNLQPRDFIVVRDEETKKNLAHAALDQHFLADAPVVIVVCANNLRCSPYGNRGRELYSLQDSAAAIENMLLAIVDLGLSSCWVGAFDEDAVSALLGIPAMIRPVALLPVGYSEDDMPIDSSRIEIDELIHFDKW